MKKEEKRYALHLNEGQLQIVRNALEEYFRVRLGQMGMLAEDLAGIGVDFSKDNPHHDRIFDSYIQCKEAARIALEAGFRIAAGYRTTKKTDQENAAYDIFAVIRHRQFLDRKESDVTYWGIDADEPRQWGPYPLPTIEREGEDEKR